MGRYSKRPGVRIICMVCAAIFLGRAPAQPDELFDIEVFRSGEGGYHTYRIPSLIVTSQGTLLAFCEGRKTSRSDDGNNDMMLKRSTDGGRTWGPMQVVYDEGEDAEITIGNPCPVVDRSTGIIWLAMNRENDDVLLSHSKDDGGTWSRPRDITSDVKITSWGWYAMGPGVGIQIRYGPHAGRLVIPANHRETPDRGGPSISHVIFSDNHGQSWRIGGSVAPHTNECQVVETLSGGKSGLLVNSRNHWGRSGGRPDLSGRRMAARSFDGGSTWSSPTFDTTLIEPTCQASLLRYSWPDEHGKSRVLFANPAARSRSNMTVRLSYDEGTTWPISKVIDPNSAAYSCLARLADGRVGLLYEKDNYRTLTFVAFTLDWLTDGRDRLRR